jgi:hypothetical protein
MISSDFSIQLLSSFRRSPYTFNYAVSYSATSRDLVCSIRFFLYILSPILRIPNLVSYDNLSTKSASLHPRSKGSAELPYITLSQHICAIEIYEAYEVHLRYRLYICARSLSESGATFIQYCSHVSVTFHMCTIAM